MVVTTAAILRETLRMRLPAGSGRVDLYWPEPLAAAPLVLVAHGFWRTRHNMAGWGRSLAEAGMAAAVPDLPAWSDHARNGRYLAQLRTFLCGHAPWCDRIIAARVGLMGFSAGGLASLLAAAAEPPVIWVGLDPVDRNGLGARAAPQVRCRALALTAEPAACNGYGNAGPMLAALPECEHVRIAGAVHVDAEWPTDRKAEAVCGRSTGERRRAFRRRALAALYESLMPDLDSPAPAAPAAPAPAAPAPAAPAPAAPAPAAPAQE